MKLWGVTSLNSRLPKSLPLFGTLRRLGQVSQLIARHIVARAGVMVLERTEGVECKNVLQLFVS